MFSDFRFAGMMVKGFSKSLFRQTNLKKIEKCGAACGLPVSVCDDNFKHHAFFALGAFQRGSVHFEAYFIFFVGAGITFSARLVDIAELLQCTVRLVRIINYNNNEANGTRARSTLAQGVHWMHRETRRGSVGRTFVHLDQLAM